MRDFNKEEAYIKAKKRVDEIRNFFIHLLVYVVINTVISTLKIVNNINNGETFSEAFFDFSTFAVWMAWGIGLTFHGVAVLSESTLIFNKWKDKKLKQYIDEEIQEYKQANRHLDQENLEDFSRKEAYFRAIKKLEALIGFGWHAVVYLVVNVFIFCVLVFVADISFKEWYTYATAFFWGIGLGIHALSLFTKNVLFSKKWEQRKIEAFMQNEQEHNSWN